MYLHRRTPLLIGIIMVIAASTITVASLRARDRNGRDRDATGTLRSPVGNELRLVGGEPTALDPTQIAAASKYLVEIFGGLVKVTPDGSIAGDLARSWAVSPDGLIYTFLLEDGVTFSDSDHRVTASAVKASLERSVARFRSRYVPQPLSDIVGARDVRDGKSTELASIEALDDHTLRISLQSPNAAFPLVLSSLPALIVDMEQVRDDPEGWSRHPHGTGPFRLQEWLPGERIVLVPNERYHGTPKPTLGRTTFRIDGALGQPQFEAGEVDATTVPFPTERAVRNHELTVSANPETDVLSFNTRQAPFDDPLVRRAFALAIDHDRLAATLDRWRGIPARSLVSPSLPGFAAAHGPPFDPVRARQLLAQSRYSGQFPRIVWAGDSPAVPGFGDEFPLLIARMWRENLGVTVEFVFEDAVAVERDFAGGKYQMCWCGTISLYPDGDAYLYRYFYSDSWDNRTGYANPRVDQMLLHARAERDADARTRLYREIEDVVLEDAPMIPLFFLRDAWLTRPYVHGWQPTLRPILQYVTVDY